jgi:hypothetical protein
MDDYSQLRLKLSRVLLDALTPMVEVIKDMEIHTCRVCNAQSVAGYEVAATVKRPQSTSDIEERETRNCNCECQQCCK